MDAQQNNAGSEIKLRRRDSFEPQDRLQETKGRDSRGEGTPREKNKIIYFSRRDDVFE